MKNNNDATYCNEGLFNEDEEEWNAIIWLITRMMIT